MRWFVLTLFMVLSAYLLYLTYFNAWASVTPVPDPEVYKTYVYVLIAGAFVTFGLGINVFLLMSKKKKIGNGILNSSGY